MSGGRKPITESASVKNVSILLLMMSCLEMSVAWLGPRKSMTRSTRSVFSPELRSSTSDTSSSITKPTLVVGATGMVGRRVVQQLLDQNRPVRALVRNVTRAQELFGTSTGFPPLEIVLADLAYYDNFTVAKRLEQAVQGCDSIISVSGALRFSKLTDFLPWRLWNADVSSWADRGHPYFANYKAQALLVDLAQKHGVSRFVRLTGRYSHLSVVSYLFAIVGSRNNQYHYLCEQHLRQSKVPFVLLKPGGLATEARDTTTTALQVVDRTILPPPARVGRADVADLAVLATDSQLVPSDHNYELSIRWVGAGIKPRPQGIKDDGYDTARQCLENVVATGPLPPEKAVLQKPSNPLVIGAVVYTLMAVALKIVVVVIGAIFGVLGL